MPFKLWHGDSVDDTDPWCPVCFNLSYENLESACFHPKDGRGNKASPGQQKKGVLLGYNLWWRARYDFQHRAEQYECVFCAVLLQIVDRFWRRTKPRWSTRPTHAYSLMVFENGSMELEDMDNDTNHRPTRFILFTPSGYSPALKGLPPAPAISLSANSKRSFQFLQAQLDTCSQEHEECNQDSPCLPTRVLDLGSSATAPHVKIFEPPSGTTGKYIALSYCWGDGGGLKAIKSNLSKLLRAIDEDELPATIQDAIELARFLGVQYLWVDALCIIQDDTQDWVHESAQMSTVYAQAFLTISASSVASSRFSFLHQSRRNHEALFRLQEDNTRGQQQDTADDDIGAVLAARRTPLSGFHQDPARGIVDPSMSRAWTLQEYMLSTRVVSFSTDEVQWTCRTLRACECGNPEKLNYPRMEELQRRLETKRHGDVGEDPDRGRLNRMSTCLNFWIEVVEAYCRRELSWMRDKLPALSGVASEFARTLNKEELAATGDTPPLRYLAGLWDTGIHGQLCWRLVHSRHDHNVEEYRAPTWSWASAEGEIYMNHSIMNDFIPQAEILEVKCALANLNHPFGQVVRKGTYLRVRATLLETQMTITRRAPGWAAEYGTVFGRLLLDCDIQDTPLDTPIWGQHSAGRTVQRRRGPHTITRDKTEQSAFGGSNPRSDNGSDTTSDAGPDSEPDIEPERERWLRPGEWTESNLGEQFIVWLVHIADSKWFGEDRPELLVLCRPAGDEEVYERIGYAMAHDNSTWVEQASRHEKSIVTII